MIWVVYFISTGDVDQQKYEVNRKTWKSTTMILGDDIGMWLHVAKYFVDFKNLINFNGYLTY